MSHSPPARAVPLLGLLSVVCLAAHSTFAQTPACDALPDDGKALAREMFSVLHPYDGCDESFVRCLVAEPPEPIVLRLASDICRQIGSGRSHREIAHALSRRAQSMLPMGKAASFDLDEAMRAGSRDAPVTVVVYACARCPFCTVLVPALHRAVTQGPLGGKVRLYFRPFPLKDHPGSTEGGMAMVGAARLGGFWPFLLELYARYDEFCPERLPVWAEVIGLDRADFVAQLDDAGNRQVLVASKREGLRNRVRETPTLFIDGRRYVYELNMEAIIDLLEEAYEAAPEVSR